MSLQFNCLSAAQRDHSLRDERGADDCGEERSCPVLVDLLVRHVDEEPVFRLQRGDEVSRARTVPGAEEQQIDLSQRIHIIGLRPLVVRVVEYAVAAHFDKVAVVSSSVVRPERGDADAVAYPEIRRRRFGRAFPLRRFQLRELRYRHAAGDETERAGGPGDRRSRRERGGGELVRVEVVVVVVRDEDEVDLSAVPRRVRPREVGRTPDVRQVVEERVDVNAGAVGFDENTRVPRGSDCLRHRMSPCEPSSAV